MKKARTLVAALLAALSMSAIVAGFAATHASAVAKTATAPCAYWTTNNGVSAVAVTSGINCTNKPFNIGLPPYNGATFENYNAFLSQVGEFVHGPGAVPSLTGMTKVGSASDSFTRHVPVYVYQGPGNNDGSSGGFNFLIHGEFPWGPV